MIHVSELGLEFKSGILFCITALVLSIIAGLAGRVPFVMILYRSFIITPVFFGVGFGILIIIKTYVPEVYEMMANLKLPKINSDQSDQKEEVPVDINSSKFVESAEKPDPEFSEFTEKDYDRLQTINDSGLDSSLNATDRKLGKHIIVENQLNAYEPKIMAQAIRTMMNKDKD